jgi:ribosomal protein L40E
MPSNRHNLTMDEQSFQGLLSAAYTIQEHNQRLNQSQQTPEEAEVRSQPTTPPQPDVAIEVQTIEAKSIEAQTVEPQGKVEPKSRITPPAPVEQDAREVCSNCGALKTAATSRCESCGADGLRPGERMQRNWASMWLMSQEQQGLWLGRSTEEQEATPKNGSSVEFKPAPWPLTQSDSAASGIIAPPAKEVAQETTARGPAQRNLTPEKSAATQNRSYIQSQQDKSQPAPPEFRTVSSQPSTSKSAAGKLHLDSPSSDSLVLDDLTLDQITLNNPTLSQVIEKAEPRSKWQAPPAENRIIENRIIDETIRDQEHSDQNIQSLAFSSSNRLSGLGTSNESEFDDGPRTALDTHSESSWDLGIDAATNDAATTDGATTDTPTNDTSLIDDDLHVSDSSLILRFTALGVKLRFHRADLYLGLAVFVSAIALLWPTAGSPQRPTLGLWDRALVTLGIAEAPVPVTHLQGDPTIQVWVDPHAAIYYCPGEEQFGKTADGRLSTQREAQMDQFEPASRSACE